MPATITFLGATGTVTGSRYLIETAGARVLVDCGLYQGLKELRLRNWEPFPLDPAAIDAVVLTHAHLDHCGYLPRLVASGFAGPIVCTAATRALARIVLDDSARLQEEDAAFANRHGYSKHRPAEPLYTTADAKRAAKLMTDATFGAPVPVAPGVTATLSPAGHILGSAYATFSLDDAGTLVVSGDLGRPNHPLLVDPAPPPYADTLLVESTYGDRVHDDTGARRRFTDAIVRTVARGGIVVIPAFAIDRTQVVLTMLGSMQREGTLRHEVPIFVDSPMALAAQEVYARTVRDGAPDVRAGAAERLLDVGHVTHVRSAEQSKRINQHDGPAIVVSASGMATGGRVLHHLAHRLPHERHTVLLVGYQAAGTRGRRLLDGERILKLLGRYVPVRAEVVDATGLSVHADRDELLAWVGGSVRPPGTTFVVHGEPDASASLASTLGDRLGRPAVVPAFAERVRIGA